MYKICNECNENKLLKEFSVASSNKDGYMCKCKKCISLRNKNYWRTPKGRISQIFAIQSFCSKVRNHPKPTYTRDQLYDWAVMNNLNLLMNVWIKSNYQKDVCPSVDRLDPNFGYSLENIRLVTWKENNDKAYLDRKNCVHVTKQNKRVEQLDLNGNHIAFYNSIASAARATGATRTNINCMCSGTNLAIKSVGGFIWKYA